MIPTPALAFFAGAVVAAAYLALLRAGVRALATGAGAHSGVGLAAMRFVLAGAAASLAAKAGGAALLCGLLGFVAAQRCLLLREGPSP